MWYDMRMKLKKHSAKLTVAPPASYKGPSLPTLAALGFLSAATALTGCEPKLSGDIQLGGVSIEPTEKGCEEPLDGDIIVLPGETIEPSEPEKPAPPEEKVLILMETGGVVAMPEFENEF